MKNRILSLVLALALAVSMCSIAVIADGGDDIGSDIDWEAENITVTAAEFDVGNSVAEIKLSATPKDLAVELSGISIATKDGGSVAATAFTVKGNIVEVEFASVIAPVDFGTLNIAAETFSGKVQMPAEEGFEEVTLSNNDSYAIPVQYTADPAEVSVVLTNLPDLEFVKAEFDYDPATMTVTFYFNQYAHLGGAHLFFCTVPNPTGNNDQHGIIKNGITYLNPYTAADGKVYSDAIEVKFDPVDPANWVYQDGTEGGCPTVVSASGIRFEEWNAERADFGDGYMMASIIHGITGSRLKANWNANPVTRTEHDMFWLPAEGWVNFMRENGTAAHKKSYLGESEEYVDDYTVVLARTATDIEIESIEITDAHTAVITTDREVTCDDSLFCDHACFYLSDGTTEFYPTGAVAGEDGKTFTLTFEEDISSVYIVTADPVLFYIDGTSICLADTYVDYEFRDKPEKPIIYGDADGNGEVEASDITMIAQFLAGGYGVDSVDEKVCDVDNNGEVEASDITMIAQFLAGGYGVDKLGPQD